VAEAHKSFNPRAREGRDLRRYELAFSHLVSIHAPAKGATDTADSTADSRVFQSTRPRRARQGHRGHPRHHRRVSIHAPAKGATALQLPVLRLEGVSIHAPAKGAT